VQDQLRWGRKMFKPYYIAVDENARVEDATRLTGFVYSYNFFISRRILKCIPMQGKDDAEADN